MAMLAFDRASLVAVISFVSFYCIARGSDEHHCYDQPWRPNAKARLNQRLRRLPQISGQAWKNYRLGEAPVDFTKVIYINLDLGTTQKLTMLQSLPRWAEGIPFERHRAYSWKRAQNADLDKYAPKGLARHLYALPEKSRWSIVAAYLSHITLLEKIYRDDPEGEGLYVILEDDAILEPSTDWKAKIKNLIEEGKVPNDWDILKIGYFGSTRCQDFVNADVAEATLPVYEEHTKGKPHAFYLGSTAYVVRPKSVPSILQQLRGLKIHDIDAAMMSLHREGQTKKGEWIWGAHTYVTKDPLVLAGLGRSTSQMLYLAQEGLTEKFADIHELHHNAIKDFAKHEGKILLESASVLESISVRSLLEAKEKCRAIEGCAGFTWNTLVGTPSNPVFQKVDFMDRFKIKAPEENKYEVKPYEEEVYGKTPEVSFQYLPNVPQDAHDAMLEWATPEDPNAVGAMLDFPDDHPHFFDAKMAEEEEEEDEEDADGSGDHPLHEYLQDKEMTSSKLRFLETAVGSQREHEEASEFNKAVDISASAEVEAREKGLNDKLDKLKRLTEQRSKGSAGDRYKDEHPSTSRYKDL